MAQPVHPAALLIDHEDRWSARERLHLGDEVAQLFDGGDVPAEQDDCVRRRLGEDLPLQVRQTLAGQTDTVDVRPHSGAHRSKAPARCASTALP
jgi:hypothetical protein